MHIDTLRHFLKDEVAATLWLNGLGIAGVKRALTNLTDIVQLGVPLDLLAIVTDLLERQLPTCSDPDMALMNLSRYWAVQRNPLSLGTLFERDPDSLFALLHIFSNSQHLSDQMIRDPESFDLVRLTDGRPVARQTLIDELTTETDVLDRDTLVMGAIRRFKYRETLRIAYGDIIHEQSLDMVTRQISYVADAILEAAYRSARRTIEAKRGVPRRADGEPVQMVILALGKLGGIELNYSSDIDLILIYDEDGQTDMGRGISNQEFFILVAREFTRLLTEMTEMGIAYRVDLRLRPDGARGPMVISVNAAMTYYDTRGRTWERQAFIKARAAAGDLQLGQSFLNNLRPWIYRRYLSRADITGIKSLKRRIERRAHQEGIDARDVKTGHGGIRDIEFVIQFLQLLNGADLPELQTGNTLEAIAQLEIVGCLTNQERILLEETYAFLRKIEHRLQIMFDLQTHLLPDSKVEMRKLALRMGYPDTLDDSPLEAFVEDYHDKTAVNRRILDHLLHDAFPDDEQTSAEIDLVLDPDPSEEDIQRVLGKYSFKDSQRAYVNLMSLSEENIRFLSTRRCRHFLAAITPQLLEALCRTPDPDSALVFLDKATASIGGKGVLWELFSASPPSLRLFVELCAYTPFLHGILTSNPGMIDELMDSLVLDRLPTPEYLDETLDTLCCAAENIEPILHRFKNDWLLRIGVRDILGKEDVSATTASLTTIADACLTQIVNFQYNRLVTKFGRPMVDTSTDKSGRHHPRPCEMTILGMGKFGGQEMSYQSDLDVVFLYEADGNTAAVYPGDGRRSTTNQHFFSELAQRIIQMTGRISTLGRLYEIDARLRPTGKSGSLALSLDEFQRYFTEGEGQLWERQALCKARPILGSKQFIKSTLRAVHYAAFSQRWQKANVREIYNMRDRQIKEATPDNLKRGRGGVCDIEFLVQMLQLKHGRRIAAIRKPNTLAALTELHRTKILEPNDALFFTAAYRALRTVEMRLHLIDFGQGARLPNEPTELAKLAHLLGYTDINALVMDCQHYTKETRKRFDRIFGV